MIAAMQTGLQAQNPLADALTAQYEQWPQEKIYVQTASDEYMPGDVVWLKVYIVDAQKLQNIDGSRYAYVDLVDAKGGIRSSAKIIVRKGLYAGYLRIPDSTGSGIYYVRAYTRYSADTPWNTYCRPLQIGQSKALEREAEEETLAPESVLKAVKHDDGLVALSVPDSRYYLVGSCRLQPVFAGGIMGGTEVAFKDLPAGKVNFYALDRDYNIVGKQLVRTDDADSLVQCRIGIRTNKSSYKTGDIATLNLDVSGIDADEIADLSITVSKNRHPFGESIGSVLLGSDPEEGLDMEKVFKGQLLDRPAPQEASQVLEGSVRSRGRRKPVKNALVRLIAPKIGQFATTTTDSTGRFVFDGADATDGTYFVLSALNEKGNDNVVINVDESQQQATVTKFPSYKEVIDTINVEYGGIDAGETIELKGLVIVADAPDYEIKGMSAMADFTLGEKEIEEAGYTCLHELLRRVPSVYIKEEKVYIRAITSIYGDNPAAIAIDGVIMPEEYDLDNIEMPMVARVDVFKTGQTVIWGTAGGSGVVSITTKTGSYIPGNKEEHPNVQKVSPVGYQPKATFKPDYRTLYWNPSIQSDVLEFPIAESASKGRWRIVLEGVTSKGRFVHEESEITIQ